MIKKLNIDSDIKNELNNHKVIVGFSGGPDSVFLLETLYTYYQGEISNKVIIAYVNYHDSKFTSQEENIVNSYIKKYNLNAYQLHANFDKKKHHNFEKWARFVRYKFFVEVADIEKTNLICIAHHKDDLIETFLIQEKRKNLPKHYGLVYISLFQNKKVIRPLLNVYKEDIINYLKNNKLSYYDDITNYFESNTRHNIRKKKYTHEIKEKIIRKIKLKNNKLNKLYDKFNKVKKDCNLDFYLKLNEDEKKRYIFYLLESSNIDLQRIEGLSKLIFDFLNKKEKGILNLDNKNYLYKEQHYFLISDIFSNLKYSFGINKEGKYINEIFEIDVTKPNLFNIKGFPFTIRNVHKGDQISTNIITKDVYNFLKKQKIPLHLRNIYPVFVNNKNEIFYVPFYIDIINKKIPFQFIIDK